MEDKIIKPASLLAILAAGVAIIALAALHVLSPEFNPSSRMVSEYALGHSGWLLSLMFGAWAICSWALAWALWRMLSTIPQRIGVAFLIASGLGEAMAVFFDIRHPLHSWAALVGIGSLPVAALLLSGGLTRLPEWSAARKPLLWAANLTWISILLMVGTFALMIISFTQAGGSLDKPAAENLPAGTIALVGWANRLLIVIFCAWNALMAWNSLKIGRGS